MSNLGSHDQGFMLFIMLHGEQVISSCATFTIALFYGFYKKIRPTRKNIFHAIICFVISVQVYIIANKFVINSVWVDLTGIVIGLAGVDYFSEGIKRVIDFHLARFKK